MSSRLAERALGDYIEALASKEPTPGGGAACALTAAQGAALLSMTIAVSGAERWDVAGIDGNQLMRRLSEARRRFLELGDRDEAAFARVMAAYRMPKGDEAEKAQRKQSVQSALQEAAQVPLAVMRLAATLLEGAEVVVARAKPTIVSDAVIAARLLDAALHASTATVEINAAAMDAAAADKLRSEVAELLSGKELILTRLIAESERVMKRGVSA